MSFLVKRPGFYSLLVDEGRYQGLHVGLPGSGPVDYASFLLGNALVGNAAPEALTALEVRMQGPHLIATAEHEIALLGTGLHLRVQRGEHSFQVAPGHTVHVTPGDEIFLPVEPEQLGGCAYLCVQGGFRSADILGSRCALQPLQGGEDLPAEPARRRPSRWVILEPWPEASPTLRLIPGTHLTDELRLLLERTTFSIRMESNRMGLRLASDATWEVHLPELISAPVVPGTLQLPPGGQPILLGVEAQTIGGYPRLGHVITPDLDQLGHLSPGKTLRFSLITQEQAEQLNQSYRNWLKNWQNRLLLSQ
ncbi:MAG TPA: hypothetical protein PKA06_10415 [Gemmatales bacterium]|nr:hypothetical protein [Gemmatales bacterium]